MKLDPVTRYVQLRAALLKEKATLEKRLAQINQALNQSGQAVTTFNSVPTRATLLTASSRRLGSRPRLANSMSLREAIAKATSSKPLTKSEILAEVKKLGYQFAGKDPMNSINVQLYTKGQFKKHSGGRFSPGQNAPVRR
jgi:hypothetical protein